MHADFHSFRYLFLDQEQDNSSTLLYNLHHYLNSYSCPSTSRSGKTKSFNSTLVTNHFCLSGPPADYAFHFPQLHIIILGRTSALLDVFAGELTDGVYGCGMEEYVWLSAHLTSWVAWCRSGLYRSCWMRL